MLSRAVDPGLKSVCTLTVSGLLVVAVLSAGRAAVAGDPQQNPNVTAIPAGSQRPAVKPVAPASAVKHVTSSRSMAAAATAPKVSKPMSKIEDVNQLLDQLKNYIGDVKITSEKDGLIKVRGAGINLNISPDKSSSFHIQSSNLKVDVEGEPEPGMKAEAQLLKAVVNPEEHPGDGPAKKAAAVKPILFEEPGMPIP